MQNTNINATALAALPEYTDGTRTVRAFQVGIVCADRDGGCTLLPLALGGPYALRMTADWSRDEHPESFGYFVEVDGAQRFMAQAAFEGRYSEVLPSWRSIPLTQTQREKMTDLIAALRSGRYKQGKGALHPLDRFCWTGVMCDLERPKAWKRIGSASKFLYEQKEYRVTPPIAIAAMYGLDHHEESNLRDMNDKGATFEEIANYLDEKYLSVRR